MELPRTKTFPISEIFGPTMQGEGAMAGVFTYFVRTAGCDYRCTWCDTAYAVLPEQVRANARKLTEGAILEELIALPTGPKWVTLSGGNPAMLELGPLVGLLHLYGYSVAMETQGSVWKSWLTRIDELTVSLKPPSSGMPGLMASDLASYLMRWKPNLPHERQVNLKVPVFDDKDYEWAAELHKEWPTIPFYLSVVTRMGGLDGSFAGGVIDSKADILARYQWLVEKASHDQRFADVRAFPQLHALVWGHGRGF